MLGVERLFVWSVQSPGAIQFTKNSTQILVGEMMNSSKFR